VEEKMDQALGEGGMRRVGSQGRRPLTKGDKRAFEADAMKGNRVKDRRLEHGGTNEIVGDEVHGEFAVNHGGGPASEDIHSHGGLDVPEEEFGEPALEIELGEGGTRESLGIEEGGDYRNGTGSRVGKGHGVGDLAESEDVRKGSPRA